MTLRELKPGQSARVETVGGDPALRQHFLDMGVTPGAEVTLIKYAPMGDPMELRVRSYALTLRLSEAAQIGVSPVKAVPAEAPSEVQRTKIRHLGLGEEGIYHKKGDGRPLPEGELLTFALLGNQNSGKTTLFNQLTGMNQHVGNFPGVTVDRKDGPILGQPNTRITDLPGIYSLSPYSSEELVSRDFVIKEHPRAIINIVDATNIERNLYLTMQILEMGIPTVVALNMMDELRGNGGAVDINRMEALLGVPVVPIAALKNKGVDELKNHAMHIARYQETPLRQDFCGKDDNGGAVHRCLHAVSHLIEDHAQRAGLPLRFAACKAAEGDRHIIEKLALDENERHMLEHIVSQMEAERGLDRAAAIADMRFNFIEGVCDECVTRPHESRERLRSQRADRVLTGRFTAIPVFIAIMALVFAVTFVFVGPYLQDLLEGGIEALTAATDAALARAGVNPVIHSMIIDGIFQGVGSVLSFLPVILVMFLCLSLLEDSGYIARVAFFMDKPLRRIGLSGRSIVPLLIGCGCTVPAVMSTRTLPSERDRRMTILLTPFMSCTAKLPIYWFFVDAFFPKYGGLVIVMLYVLGVCIGIAAAAIAKRTVFRGEPVPLVLELPNYRLPGFKNVMRLMWEKAWDFLRRAFSVILVATVLVWFLSGFDIRINPCDAQDSMLAWVAGLIAPLLKPLGLGDWRVATSLISGFMAKESVVSVMEMLYEGGVASALTPLAAASMLVFSLLYTPCVAAIASVRRELGGRWAAGVALWQCGIAWVAALAVRLIGMAVGL